MISGAAAGLAAQWGLIPKLALGPRALLLWGTLIAAIGLAIIVVAGDLYGLVLGFAVSSLGFGFTRPGFTAGSSLAVSLAEQGSVAGVITAANGIAFVAAPAIGMLLYGLDTRLPFAVAVGLLLLLAAWVRARL